VTIHCKYLLIKLRSDIKGANSQNWISILVKSGLFKGENDLENPATLVFDNFIDSLNYFF
jgi:ribonucleotide monophosphatase NagD (HAD superfamily)